MNQPGQGRKLKATTIVDKLRGRDINNAMPSCPAWLSLEAKRIWKREAPKLHEAGLLSFVDGPAFANYCLLRAQLKQAYEELGGSLTYMSVNKNGSEYEMAKPQVAIVQKCIDQLKGYAAEFGMTPASRSRIPAKAKDTEKPKQLSRELHPDPRAILEEMKN
jgi:P27 family predicted phage terminase small subunit